ncbi:MAG: hypothetical protein QOI81_2123 [Actinomycetota bacterium]|jgi:hypothetical protein|nr:hypothetical protein [Actinomycetota bacterium]
MRVAAQTADVSIAGRAIWQAAGSRPRTFPVGRVCREKDCTTVLSIYNRREQCAEHEVAKPHPPRFGRPRTADLRVNRQLVTIADFVRKGA